ncbi:MAG: hypothetical protein M1839_003792 [Geoglossum umbratile]|nr:MAG: hypothetical protein M1839_003792 [Geoglossum umbratile]
MARTPGNPAKETPRGVSSAGAAGYGAAGVNAIARASAVVTEATALLNARQENGARKEVEERSLKEKMVRGSWLIKLRDYGTEMDSKLG